VTVSVSVEVVGRWLAAFNARDERALLATAHAQIVVRPLRWGVRSEYRGHDGVRDWLHTLAANPEASTLSTTTIQPLPDGRVLAEGAVDHDGAAFVGLYVVRDELIAEVHGYLSDRALLEQLGLIASA
jgi:hypothetical protein